MDSGSAGVQWLWCLSVWMVQYSERIPKTQVRKRQRLPLNLKLNIRENCCFECECVHACVCKCTFMWAVQWHLDQQVTPLLRCSECVCFYVCSAVTFWPTIDFSVRLSCAYECHPPGGDRMDHTEWVTFHLPAPPQCPQVVPLCRGGEGRWVPFIWKMGLWGVKEHSLK